MIQTDFLPTFFEIATGREYLDSTVDGISFLPLLTHGNDEVMNKRTMIWHFPYYHPEGRLFESVAPYIGIEDEYVSQTRPHSAIRKDNYKLLYFYEDEHVELYNLAEDQREQIELSGTHQAVSSALKKELVNALARVGARLPR